MNWQLPESTEDILPKQAILIERWRTQLLEEMSLWGYELVMPSLIEFSDSLPSGREHDFNNKTIISVDRLTGGILAVRPDITPQIARIDSHVIKSSEVTRYAYCGPVVHAVPSNEMSSRELLQLGAEIYGTENVEADIEVIYLLERLLHCCEFDDFVIDLSHIGIYRSLAALVPLPDKDKDKMLSLVQHKNQDQLFQLLEGTDPILRKAILSLLSLNGPSQGVLDQSKEIFTEFDQVSQYLLDLESVIKALGSSVNIDLADLHGYHYHNGMVFAAYLNGAAKAICYGGRYGGGSYSEGMTRSATGFSLDLIALSQLSVLEESNKPIVLAPSIQSMQTNEIEDVALLTRTIHDLREQGYIVVHSLQARKNMSESIQSSFSELVYMTGSWNLIAKKEK